MLSSCWPNLKSWSKGAPSSRRKFCGQSRNSFSLSLGYIQLVPMLRECNGSVESWTPVSIPLSIFTATVRQVGDFLMPNADAWTTFPKAPLPSDLPTMKRRHWFACQASRMSLSLLGRKCHFSYAYVRHGALNGITNELTPKESRKGRISGVSFFQVCTVLLRYPHPSQLGWAPRRHLM